MPAPLAAELPERRRRFLQSLGASAALVVADEGAEVYEGERRSNLSSDLYYLTGWTGRGAALFRPLAEQPFVLFVDPRDLHQEAVTGPRPGLGEAKEHFGADEALPFRELEGHLGWMCEGHPSLHYAFGHNPSADQRVLRALRDGRRSAGRSGVASPSRIEHSGELIGELRLRKDATELAAIRAAGRITAEAHTFAMRAGRPGVREYAIEALVDGTFRGRGGSGGGYDTIVGGGANACVLHYSANDAELRDGDLCLVDAGCRYAHYTADVTRAWPVSGRFSGPQRALYEVVLAAWSAAVAQVRVGEAWVGMRDAALRVLCEGLVALELVEGDVDTVIQEERYRRFYAHEIGHWLGLDVHDPGGFFAGGRSRRFEAGQVLAVEPGLYVRPDDEHAPPAFRGVGVRIEDDLLVTDAGAEVLTECPRAIEDVEAATRR